MKSRWLETNTFHHSIFKDIQNLVDAKNEKGVRISLCLPTWNEEKTIAKELVIMTSELKTRYPLLDEILIIDSGSKDRTMEIAKEFGAKAYKASDILPDHGNFRGKGENLWKALYVAQGDIIVYLDADIKNVHHKFVYGLLGPLLIKDNIKFSKAFYDRPIALDDDKGLRPTGGGRVTELVIRPLFSLFFPELTQIMQPLSGEYAGFREIFEKIPFPIGYGVETSMILDIYQNWGLDVVAQVDLDQRIHRNRSTKSLGKMAFVIMQTFINRTVELGLMELNQDSFDEMIQYIRDSRQYKVDIAQFQGRERPPIIKIPEYIEKYNL